MFKRDKILEDFVTRQDLGSVWIRANETPCAPLICIWTDAKMRAFEAPEVASTTANAAKPAEEGPESPLEPLMVEGIKHSI
jgi:hypothetical protein